MGFQETIQLIRDGEGVTAGVTNRPTRQLDGNVRHLKDLIDALQLGSALYARGVTVEADAQVGMPVYWNAAASRFERALAATAPAAEAGALVTADSARVWGVVASKAGATLADLVLSGYLSLDVAAAVGGPAAAGQYYLSGTTPGGLTRQQPPVSVAVLRSDGAGKVSVDPDGVDFLERHVHYKFPLVCRPAGLTTAPIPGERHAIAAPDPDQPGWLPADHPTFAGKAPLGAAFGYNLAQDPALQAVWPPLPMDNAALEWNKGVDPNVGGTAVPLGAGGLCRLTRDGIWWLSDCYGDVPWPAAYDSGDPTSASLSESTVECPRSLAMTLDVWFTRLNFATDAAAVTSLRSASPQLVVRCIDGAAATVGDLEIVFDPDWTSVDGAAGYQVLKELDGTQFKRGPVCEGLYALSGNVTLTGAATGVAPNDGALYQGPVGIAVAPEASRELDVELIRLDRAETATYQDTTYIGFREAQASAIRCKLAVPATAAGASAMALRLRLLGRALGVLPALTVTARRLPAPAPGGTVQLPLDAAEFAVTIDTARTLALGNQYVDVTSEPFPVAAGDVVFFTVARADSDGYPGEVGLIHQAGVLSVE